MFEESYNPLWLASFWGLPRSISYVAWTHSLAWISPSTDESGLVAACSSWSTIPLEDRLALKTTWMPQFVPPWLAGSRTSSNLKIESKHSNPESPDSAVHCSRWRFGRFLVILWTSRTPHSYTHLTNTIIHFWIHQLLLLFCVTLLYKVGHLYRLGIVSEIHLDFHLITIVMTSLQHSPNHWDEVNRTPTELEWLILGIELNSPRQHPQRHWSNEWLDGLISVCVWMVFVRCKECWRWWEHYTWFKFKFIIDSNAHKTFII